MSKWAGGGRGAGGFPGMYRSGRRNNRQQSRGKMVSRPVSIGGGGVRGFGRPPPPHTPLSPVPDVVIENTKFVIKLTRNEIFSIDFQEHY